MNFDFIIQVYLFVLFFALGSVMGSFLDCAAERYVRGEKLPKGRSCCDRCGHILSAKDLIPIFSFLASRGRCSYCKERIPKECLVVELLTAVLFSVVWLHMGWSWELVMYLILCALLMWIALIDWKIHIIPDWLVLAMIGNRLFFCCFEGGALLSRLFALLVGACSVSIPLLLLSVCMDHILKKDTMGGGDIKLLFALGMYMHWAEMLLLLFVGCVIALIYIFCMTKKDKNSEFAFAPFLCCAWLFVFLFGENIFTWYLSLIFGI